jgi:hypothetical protein
LKWYEWKEFIHMNFQEKFIKINYKS